MADFHVHTTLKPYLFARSLWRETSAPRRFSPFSFRSGLPALLRGGVRTAVVAHHVPEAALFRDSFLARAGGRLLSPTYPWLREGRPFARLEEMLALLEWEAELAPERVAVVRSSGSCAGPGRAASWPWSTPSRGPTCWRVIRTGATASTPCGARSAGSGTSPGAGDT